MFARRFPKATCEAGATAHLTRDLLCHAHGFQPRLERNSTRACWAFRAAGGTLDSQTEDACGKDESQV